MSLEEIESSHTLGLVGKVDRVEGRGEGVNANLLVQIHQSDGRSHNMPGGIVITDAPLYIRERGKFVYY